MLPQSYRGLKLIYKMYRSRFTKIGARYLKKKVPSFFPPVSFLSSPGKPLREAPNKGLLTTETSKDSVELL